MTNGLTRFAIAVPRLRAGALIAGLILAVPAHAKTVAPPPPFQPWLETLRAEAAKRGIRGATLDVVLTRVKPIPRVIELDRRQPEFTLTMGGYFRRAINDKRIAKGRAMLKKHKALLSRVAAKFGVQPRFLVSFWGLESDFGRVTGSFPVVGALVTLAHDRRRAKFFREQLLAVLKLIDQGHVPATVKGSWAGAMGNHQFIPTTYRGYAVDFDGDGKRDLWNSLPDIFASAANYLSRSGWDKERTWGREVKIPAGFDIALAGMDTRKSLTEWAKLGIHRPDGKALPKVDVEGSVLLPAGYRGPAFVVYKNYRTTMVWNRSHLYALAVGHLADRFIGKGPLQGKLSDADSLTRQNILEMQRLLARKGFDPGTPDGRVGPMTRNAIKGYQTKVSLPPDGFPTMALIKHLRGGSQ